MVWPGTVFEYLYNKSEGRKLSEFPILVEERNAKKVYEQSILAKRSVNNQRKKVL